MASSHAVKRFFYAFGWGRIWVFRYLLLRLFLWHLRQVDPDVVRLGLDPMVMDNDAARLREGAQPTYKKMKGFQPLQLTWRAFVIDALFRGGKKHGNAGDVAGKVVARAVRFLRRHYRADVPIVVALDSGFFDQKLFRLFEELGIGYVRTSPLDDELTDRARRMPAAAWSVYDYGRQEWEYFEFGNRRKSWKRDGWRRAFYTRPVYEAFKRDVSESVLPATSYATRFRRQVIDWAAKIVRTGGETFLKVTAVVWDRLRIPELWDRTADPPRFACV